MTQPVTGSFTATGQSSSFRPVMRTMAWGQFNVFLSGTAVATVQLERSYDSGTTWCVISVATAGAPVQMNRWTYDSGTLANQSSVIEEPEPGVVYRLNCTAYTSGTLAYRISQ